MPSPRFRTGPRGWVGVAVAAAIVGAGVPTQRSTDAQELVLRLRLAECNAATEAYRRDHGQWPGHAPGPALEPPASVELLLGDLTQPKRARSPYLGSWPIHPVTGSRHIRRLDDGPTVLEEGVRPAWTWRPSTGQIASDPMTRQDRPHPR